MIQALPLWKVGWLRIAAWAFGRGMLALACAVPLRVLGCIRIWCRTELAWLGPVGMIEYLPLVVFAGPPPAAAKIT